MITYNPKDWFTLITKFHKSDTFRKLFWSLVSVGIYAALVVYAEIHFFNVKSKNPTVLHSILGFVLSLLLVFRTNSAYDRWWEGRKLWGSFLNNSRNLALKLSAALKESEDRFEIKFLITNYLFAAKNHLRDSFNPDDFLPTQGLSLSVLEKATHKPNTIAKALHYKIRELHQSKMLTNEELINLNSEIKSFTDDMGACERIKNTPIPYSYNIFLKKMIFLYCLSMPLFFGFEFGYTTIPITIIILYVFASIELIAEEIEDPFGEDYNDLPIDDICNKAKNNLDEILD
jgi:ion channel-forming bestrophin family protein